MLFGCSVVAFASNTVSNTSFRIPKLIAENLDLDEYWSKCAWTTVSNENSSFDLGFGVTSTSTGKLNSIRVAVRNINLSTNGYPVSSETPRFYNAETGETISNIRQEYIDIIVVQKEHGSISIIEGNEILPGEAKTYGIRIMDKKQNIYSDAIEFAVSVPSNLFSSSFDSYYVNYNETANAFCFVGKKRDSNSEPAIFGIYNNAFSTRQYEAYVLPAYDSLKDIPSGLKVIAYYVIDNGNKVFYEPGSPAINGAEYCIDVEIDTSNPQNLLAGVFNFIIFKLFTPIMEAFSGVTI